MKTPEQFVPGSASRGPWLLLGLGLVLFGLVVFLHVWQLEAIPTGYIKDEGAIALNAHHIATDGRDEYGLPWPVYFRSFDDYKAPVYIYSVAAVFKLAGTSVLHLRLTSTLWFFVSLGAVLLLVARLFPGQPLILLYTLLAYGLLPGVFAMSRQGVEVVSQVALFCLSLLLLWLAFESSLQRARIWAAAGCGVIFGLCLYAYPTSRMLAPGWLAMAWVLYGGRRTLGRLGAMTATFLLATIPYLVYSAAHPGAMTRRFRGISYLFYADLALQEKIRIFLKNYISHFSPDFLLVHGDANLRNNSGYGGIVFLVVLLLVLAGIWRWISQRGWLRDRFFIYLLGTLFLTPLAASLTTEVPHAVRACLMGPSLFVLSCYGLNQCLAIRSRRTLNILLASLALILVVQVIAYQVDYFRGYSRRSAEVTMGYGFPERLQQAVDQHPQAIFYVAPDISYAYPEFFRLLLPGGAQIPLRRLDSIAQLPPDGNTCLLYRAPKIGDAFGGSQLPAPAGLEFGDAIAEGIKLRYRGNGSSVIAPAAQDASNR